MNIPAEQIEEPYNLRKSDIDNLAQNYIKDYTSRISRLLNEKGLVELYDFYEIKKVEKYSYLVIFGFSVFNTRDFLWRLYFIFLPLITTTILISLFLLFN